MTTLTTKSITPRIIKFRAWDKEDKRFATEPEVGGILYEIQANPKADVLEVYILMQFTGLHDKDGKEIYEGDIVRLIEPNRLYTVEYLDFSYKLVHADPKLERMHWGPLYRISELDFSVEVIGNIYSNPELIEGDSTTLK